MGVEIEVTKALENGDTLHLRPGEREGGGTAGRTKGAMSFRNAYFSSLALGLASAK